MGTANETQVAEDESQYPMVPYTDSRKNAIPEGESKVRSMVLGLFQYAGRLGISKGTTAFPHTTALLAAYAQKHRRSENESP